MVSLSETITRLSRVPANIPPLNPDLDATRRLATSIGVEGVDRADADAPARVKLSAAARTVATLELRPGASLVMNGLTMSITKAKGWRRVDTALFGAGDGLRQQCCAAWLHQPYPPPIGEVPSLLLEAIARLGGQAAGIDGILRNESLRLTHGTVSHGNVSATIAQPCICANVRGDHHGGAALGATLKIYKDRHGKAKLNACCQHAEGCNTILCSHALSPTAHETLEQLFAAAVEHSAPAALPELTKAAEGATAAGRALLDAMASLSSPSQEAIAKARSGSWEAWRSDRPPNKDRLVGRIGKRGRPRELAEDHACLALRSFADKKTPRVATCDLEECFSAAGFKRARDDLDGLQPTKPAEKRRKHWLSTYLDAVDASYGQEVDADGLRWQRVPYGQRPDSEGKGTARQEAVGVRTMIKRDGKNLASVCLQGMPRDLRPYACSGVARDLDFKMCHPLIFAQLPAMLTWSTPRDPPSVTEICKLCREGGMGRDELFKELAIWHKLDADADRWPGYRKDLLKKLVTQLFYGGCYWSWIQKSLLPPRESDDGTKLPPVRDPRHERRHPRVDALGREVRALREAIFTSEQWAAFVAMWRKLLHAEKGGDKDAIDRSVMSRIAQELEDRCLRAMVAQLGDDGWEVLAIVYDGCIVRDQGCFKIDWKRLEDRVLKETGLKMIVEEKELFDAKPTLTLARDSD